MDSGKASCPAGTGVWVVKSDEERTTSSASLNDSLWRSISLLMRSMPIKAACPSLQWKMSDCMPRLVQCADAAYAEQDFLPEAVLEVAAVEVVGDGAVFDEVQVVVGIEQVEFRAA